MSWPDINASDSPPNLGSTPINTPVVMPERGTGARLPIYILADISHSMIGEGFQALNGALRRIGHILRTDPLTMRVAHIGLIPFATFAYPWPAPGNEGLVQVAQFYPEPLGPEADGRVGTRTEVERGAKSVEMMTRPGEALRYLSQRITQDVVARAGGPNDSTIPDYRPLVFLVSDAETIHDQVEGTPPRPVWQRELVQLERHPTMAPLWVIPVGCGNCNVEFIRRMGEQSRQLFGERAQRYLRRNPFKFPLPDEWYLLMDNTDVEFERFVQLVTASAQIVSSAMDGTSVQSMDTTTRYGGDHRGIYDAGNNMGGHSPYNTNYSGYTPAYSGGGYGSTTSGATTPPESNNKSTTPAQNSDEEDGTGGLHVGRVRRQR